MRFGTAIACSKKASLEVDRAMARVDLSRAEDYLEWSGSMGTLGYVSQADMVEDRLALIRAEVAWNKADVALETFQRSTAQTRLRDYEAKVEQARTQLAFAIEEVEAAQTRLDHLEEQVSFCTIRAPHDGAVLYTDVFYREYYQVREGAEIYPGLSLFILPDLSKMEVELFVHERFSRLVKVGQEAEVHFEAFPGQSVLGKVKDVDLMPTPDWYHFEEWQQFRVLVALDEVPEGLLPEMTARVEITVGSNREALTVPAEAVGWDDDGPFCVVESPSGPTQRRVQIDRGTVDRLVVREGLEENESVLLQPVRNAF